MYYFTELLNKILDIKRYNINIILKLREFRHIDCISMKCRCYKKRKYLCIRIFLDSFCQMPCNCRHFIGSLCPCLHNGGSR